MGAIVSHRRDSWNQCLSADYHYLAEDWDAVSSEVDQRDIVDMTASSWGKVAAFPFLKMELQSLAEYGKQKALVARMEKRLRLLAQIAISFFVC